MVLPSVYSNFIHTSRYGRWDYVLGRRETWVETVDRYINYMCDKQCAGKIPDSLKAELRLAILNLEAMPSMRCLMTAGPALDGDNAAGFNCVGLVIDTPVAFSELMYVLMCGCGAGFSVERQFIKNMPTVAEKLRPSKSIIKVDDSRMGWANALGELLGMLYQGRIPEWDVSEVRPKGAPLKTFGGRASGPEPLEDLFRFVIEVFRGASGRQLDSLECHDICCKIGEVVVAGGVRRSAEMSISNLSDLRMRGAKSGDWYMTTPWRSMANNSACYTEKPPFEVWYDEWGSLLKSKSGERGIFNREAAKKHMVLRGRRDTDHDFICNPCGEIILRPNQMCNLSEAVIRPEDTVATLKRKIRIATILGTMQATLTNFRYLRDIWKKNCEEEALLGVSLTGIMDNQLMSGQLGKKELNATLEELRDYAIAVNKEWAKKLGIKQAAAVTTVKPSGCRPWDALTTTDRGILTLEEMLEDHTDGSAWSDYKQDARAIQHDGDLSGITRTFVNGESPVLRIRMAYGLEVESTPNHEWFVKSQNAFVRADALKFGDILDIVPGIYKNPYHSPLAYLSRTAIAMREDADEIRQPQCMNPDLAWLLGYLWGDGAMSPSKYRLRWTDGRVGNLVKAQRILKEQFGLDSEFKPCSDGREASALEVGSKMLWHWLIRNNVWKYFGAEDTLDLIPVVVRKSSREDIIAFIAGLIDADGWCGPAKPRNRYKVTLTTAYPLFASHVQHVGWTVGLGFGRSHNVGGKNLQQVKSMYLLGIGQATDPEAFALLVKHSDKLGTVARQFPDTAMAELWHAVADAPNRLIPGKVVSVTAAGVKPTYDVETVSHWFYAGAVRSHNTVSQLVDSASGMHPRWSQYYIRTVRGNPKDPVTRLLKDQGFPWEPSAMNPDNEVVFSFPMKAPEGCITTEHVNATEQLELWKCYREHWCEHQPSITVYVKDWEWMGVGHWVYTHWDIVGGLSFLPKTSHSYKQPPYQAVSEKEYLAALAKMPEAVDWAALAQYESDDSAVTAGREAVCTGDSCEIVDIGK